jgi:hypothetical protein
MKRSCRRSCNHRDREHRPVGSRAPTSKAGRCRAAGRWPMRSLLAESSGTNPLDFQHIVDIGAKTKLNTYSDLGSVFVGARNVHPLVVPWVPASHYTW